MPIQQEMVALWQRMQAAGAPIIPGDNQAVSDDELLEAGTRLDFPLLIKAASGGGGIGVRAVSSLEKMPAALFGARREAKASVKASTQKQVARAA